MKKAKIIIQVDIAKEAKKLSRQRFSGTKLGSRPHKSKKKYTRKTKHKT